MNYLTVDVKEKLLKELDTAMARENVDDRWLTHLVKVNKRDGVCTVGCCQGHRREMLTSSSRGYITLLFTGEKQRKFDKLVGWLLGTFPVVCVKKSYGKLILDNLRRFDDRYYCMNEIYFELWAFKDFIEDCFYPLLDKLELS